MPGKRPPKPSAPPRADGYATALLAAIAEGVIGFDAAFPHCLRFANPRATELLGVAEAQARGRPLGELLTFLPEADSCCRSFDDWHACVRGGHFEIGLRTPGRAAGFPALLCFERLDDGSGLAVLTLREITARRETEQRLRLAEKVFEHSAEAIVITDGQGVILAVNPAFTWLTGYRPDEAIGQTPRILKSGRHDDAFYAAMWRTLAEDGHWEGELWDRRKDGSHYPKWLAINAVKDGGRTSHYVALFADISERKENENRIRFLAEHDHLTGLPNRRLMESRARHLMAADRRGDGGLALLLIDLDRFKHINDTLGHPVGDRLLIEVARRLVASVRATDTVVRLGGDEFVVLLEGMAGPGDTAAVAHKIWEALNGPVVVDGMTLHAPPSIGISVHPGDGDDIDTLLKNADTAMYQVKAAGRNSWLFYKPAMNDEAQERLRLEGELRRGLATEQLQLHFQPQFDLHSRDIIAWEALLRWPHPELGWLPPKKLVAVAEAAGLIVPLGDWVLRAACAEAVRWEQAGLGRHRLSVNLAPGQLTQPMLAERVRAILDETGLPPARLELEITENVLLARSPVALDSLRRLKDMGIFLTLDDFGTGYSSLAHLKSLALDRVKIDRSFVRDIARDPGNAAIVRAMISLAQALELGVLAEGVETEEQQAIVAAQGCRETQGFLLGEPMPGSAVADFLANWRGAAKPN